MVIFNHVFLQHVYTWHEETVLRTKQVVWKNAD